MSTCQPIFIELKNLNLIIKKIKTIEVVKKTNKFRNNQPSFISAPKQFKIPPERIDPIATNPNTIKSFIP